MPRRHVNADMYPIDVNELWQKVTAKMKKLQKIHKMSLAVFARNLGITKPMLRRIYDKGMLPEPALCERIIKLFWENTTWEKTPTLYSYKQHENKTKWPRLRRIPLNPVLYKRIQRTCRSSGYSIEAFVQLAIERLLDHEPTMVTVRRGIDRVSKALLEQIYNENPLLWDIMEGSPSLSLEIHANTSPRHASDVVESTVQPIERLANIPIGNGPASSIMPRRRLVEI